MVRALSVLLALAATAWAQDARELEANKLYKEFVGLGRKPADAEFKRRRAILWRLGELMPQSRAVILKIPAKARIPHELALVAYQLEEIDGPAVRDLFLKHATRFKEPMFSGFIATHMLKNVDDATRKWIVEEGLKSTNPIVCQTCCWLAWSLKMKEAADALRAVQRRTMKARKHGRTAFGATAALLYSRGATREEALTWAQSGTLPLRMAAARTVPYLPVEEMREVVTVLLDDPDWRIRRRTLRSIHGAKQEAYFDALVKALESDPRLACRATAHGALVAISGRDLDYDAAAWRQWLKDRKSVPPEEAKKRTYTHARYYGEAIVADRVCFVVDLSRSMERPTNHATPRIAVARAELQRALGALPESTYFNIIVFSEEARAWRKRPTKATKKRVAAAQAWIEETFVPDGRTHTWQALELAFDSDPDLDTIYLLSDGSPSLGKWRNYADTAWALRDMGWNRQVTIHTIALSLSDLFKKKKDTENWGEKYMRRVARATGGRFRAVTKPPR